MIFSCPKCGRPIGRTDEENATRRNRFFPFCSERCKLIDLGAWLDAEYRIELSEKEEDAESADE
ncbi:MAG: DNA gyrase inhibitor YacG [Phycisphaerae bacterium]|nr:DNA gyrase inhibitor YacG [Phycisphaerae bacterium]